MFMCFTYQNHSNKPQTVWFVLLKLSLKNNVFAIWLRVNLNPVKHNSNELYFETNPQLAVQVRKSEK